MIHLQNVSKSYDGKPIISNLSLHVEAGEKVTIIGPSGCGKSTLLRLILGLHPPDSGDIKIGGRSILGMSDDRLKKIRLESGMLFQSGALFDSLNVEDNVAFPLRENFDLSPIQVKRKVKEKLEMVEMSGFEKAMPSDLSGGQRKRIGLARAIAADPKIVLFDEPTTGLDPIVSTIIEDLIVKLSLELKVTIVVVTHQISTILRTGDRIFLMKDRRLLSPVTPAEVQQRSDDYGRFVRGEVG